MQINFNSSLKNQFLILIVLSPSEFPLTDENFNDNEFSINSKSLIKTFKQM